MLHSKMMVIDGVWSIIGSANIDTRSIFFNVENVIGIHSESFAKKLEEVFVADLAQSKQITKESWKKRGIHRKILEPLTSFIDKQL